MNIPTDNQLQTAVSRLQRHAKGLKLRRKGIKEIRTRHNGPYLFLDLVKEEKSGLVGRMFGMGSMRGVAKVGRLEFLGPNKWRPLYYKADTQKYASRREFQNGPIEACVEAVLAVFA